MKKVLKYVLWAFLVVAGVTGLAILGTVITKGFNPTKVYINSLTINGQKEYAVISDNDDSYTGRVDFLPAEANQLTLTAKIVTGNDVIEEITPVTAGQDFTIKFKKVPELDANGQVIPDSYITKGGEIEIKFVDSSQNAFATLKVLVDVGLKSNYVDVVDNSQGTRRLSTLAGNNNTLSETVNIATSKKNQFKIECRELNMINSYKGAWTQSDVNNVIDPNRMKKILYFNSDDDKDINGADLVTEKRVSDLSVTNINTATEKSYLFTYYSPYPTIKNGANDVKLATVSTYIYRTYYLESIFSETLANSIITSLKTNNYSDTALDYASINEFVNNYMYSRCSVAQKAALDKVVNKIGLVEFGINNAYNDRISALNEVLNFVFVRFNIEINVKNIKVVSINASPEVNFNVFEGGTFSVEDLITDDTTNHLWVNLKADNSSVDNDVLKANLRNVEIIVCKRLLDDDDVDEGEKLTFTDSATQTQIAAQIIDDMTLKVNKITENGVTKWEFNPMVNTFTSDDYFLVYKYQNEVENVTLVTLTQKTGTGKTTWYYKSSDGWKIFNADKFDTPNKAALDNIIKLLENEEQENNQYTRAEYNYSYNITSGIWKNETTGLDINNTESEEYLALNYLFENSGTTIYGYSPYKVNYKEGSIYFNKSSEAFVLNTARRIYKRNTDLVESEVTGLNRGSKQYGLDDLAGSFKDDTMTYKTIKWVVKKDINVEDEIYYKLLPTFRRTVNEETENYNTITYKFKYALTGVDYSEGNGADAQQYEFMEVGTTYIDNDTTKSTFNLRALNVLDGSMELYAFVVQTLADGTPRTTKDGLDTYLYYATNAPAKQKITIDNYIDNLYAYATVDVYKDGVLDENGKNQFTCISDRSEDTGHNANDVILKVVEGETGTTFYLSSCKLKKDGETITDYTEDNRLYLKDIVCYDENGNRITVGTSENYIVVQDKYINVSKNEKQAMKNFIEVSATKGKQQTSYTFNDEVIRIANIEEDGNIEATITLEIEFDAANPYLKVTITTSVSSELPVYSLKVFTNAPQSSEKMYSDIKNSTTGESNGGVEFYIKSLKTQVENT